LLQLEALQLAAFAAYQEEAARLDAKDVVTDEEKKNLDGLRLDYEATRKVKQDIVLGEVANRLAQAKDANGLDGLGDVVR
jgi:hypothetical protein